MRILHLSDTHGLHRQLKDLPDADVLIHSGDLSFDGAECEVSDFIEWFGALEYSHKIFIAGNHDFCLKSKMTVSVQGRLPVNCHYLNNSGVSIEGIKFWGIPFFFRDSISDDFIENVIPIPADTDVVISHRPPFGILDTANDRSYGCIDLLQTISKIRPRYHLFGHIHDSYGILSLRHTTYVNASLVDEEYRICNKPFVVMI